MVHALSAAFPGLRIISEEHSSGEDNTDYDIVPIHVDRDLLDDEKYAKLPNNFELPLSELTVWIDPLDATKEYTEGLTQFVTTMVCVARNGDPIIGVIHKPFDLETYWAWTQTGMSSNVTSSNVMSSNIMSSISQRLNTNNSFRIVVSRSHAGDIENVIKSTFSDKVKIESAAGSGYKTLELIKGKAEAYIHITLIKKWDICAPNAILNAIKNAKLTTINGNQIKYGFDDNVKNEDGLIATIGSDHQKLINLFKNRKH
jgi:inositol monophosphatase 3